MLLVNGVETFIWFCGSVVKAPEALAGKALYGPLLARGEFGRNPSTRVRLLGVLDRRLISFLGLLVAIAAALDLSWAAAATVTSRVRVSGDSPFATCPVGSAGTPYGNAEAEPWLAVNPTNPSNLAGTWQQDRWSGGAARGTVAGYSFDGGRSWSQQPLPFTSCVPGGLAYERASDPWISFGPDGTAYAAALALGQSSTAVVAATSSDGGRSWTNVREIIMDGGAPRRFFNDKPSLTAHPTAPGVAYAVWDRLESGRGDPDAGARPGAPRAPAYLARTGDGGRTWSEPRAITSADAGQTLGNHIVVDPRTGALYDFFNLITLAARGRLRHSVAFVKSTDDGATWTRPETVAQIRSAPVPVPDSGESIRAGGVIPQAAIDPASGKLYVVWMDSRFGSGGYPEIAISSSADGGESWSAPARVNRPTGGPAFTPAVAVGVGGSVGVTYFDFRSRTTETDVLPTDYWAVFSTDGGASFGGATRVAGPFDVLSAPNSGGYFLGDYHSLVALGESFVSFFVQANSGETANRTDVWSAIVNPRD